MIKKKTVIALIVVIIIVVLLGGLYWLYRNKRLFFITEILDIGKEYIVDIVTVNRPEIPYSGGKRKKWGGMGKSLPYIASSPIDIDNSGAELIFLGGNINEDDLLLKYQNGRMVNVIKGTGLSEKKPATHGAVSVDMDGDGYQDLIVARENGVTLYKNNRDGTFTGKKIIKELPDRVPIALSVADFNKDQIADVYVSYFIRSKDLQNFQFNNPKNSKANVLLKGEPGGSFTDVSGKIGPKGYSNTFTSVWSDLDNDGDPDLILSQDAGDIEIYENVNGNFVRRKINIGKGFWMGIAAGDYDGDGDQDLYLSNIGDYITKGSGLSSGSGRTGIQPNQKLQHNHVLLRNDGNFKFVDVKDQKIGKYTFGWGAVFEDLNLDGTLDLLLSLNYVLNPLHKYIKHPNVALIQNKQGKFNPDSSFSQYGYGQTPITVDLTGDGIKDVVWVNMVGPHKFYKNTTKANFINVKLPSDIRFVNAKVYMYLPNGKVVYQEKIQGGIGLGGDQSEILAFGLGKQKKVDKIKVVTQYNKEYTIPNPKINSTVYLKP